MGYANFNTILNKARRFIAVLAALTLSFSLLGTSSLQAFAAETTDESFQPMSAQSGICGEGVNWEIDSDGQLRIFGEGTLDVMDKEHEVWWYPYHNDVNSVVVESGVMANADSSYLFADLRNAETMDLSGFDISNAKDVGYMFHNCASLTELDLSSFDTSNVNYLSGMFYGCTSLSCLDLSSFDTSNVMSTTLMFRGCSSITALDLSSWNTSRMNYMCWMFLDCTSLAELDISSFDTSGISDEDGIQGMMSGCRSLCCVSLSSDGDFSGLLPTPDPEYIPGATGNWLNTEGEVFTSTEIPAYVADTYTAEGATFDNNIPETEVSITGLPLTMEVGSEVTLSVTPEDAIDEGVIWESSDEDVLVVDENGDAIAVYTGIATITATVGEASATCDVTVCAKHIASTVGEIDYSASVEAGNIATVRALRDIAIENGDVQLVVQTQKNLSNDAQKAIDNFAESESVKVAETLEIFLQGDKGAVSIDVDDELSMTVRLQMTDQIRLLSPDTLQVTYVSESGGIEAIPTWVDGDALCFTTSHLSTYVVTGEEQNSGTGDNTGDQSGEEPGGDQPSEEPSDDPTGDQPGDEPTGEEPGNDPSSEQPSDGPTGEEPSGEQTGGEQGDTSTGDSTQTVATQTMYRLYNPNSGEHFYTANAGERDMLKGLGWSDEGTGWIAPTTGDLVYRLYNPNAGEHHYTTNASEKAMLERVGWSYEGIGWYSGGNVRLYREYNPNAYANNHNYTTSKSEHDWLLSLGWNDEGYAWNAVAVR